MKILYFIAFASHGRGGHVHSLSHISNEISNIHDTGIVSIGSGNNSTISMNPNYITHIYFNGLNLFKLKKTTKKIIDEYEPDIIHCFDIASYNIIALLYLNSNYKIVLTKCGGPNPTHPYKYPYIHNLILFSNENKIWFENNPRYQNSNISLIPNRVNKITTETLDIIKPKNYFSFVKIARIGPTYKQSIIDSIHLIDKIHEKNNNLKIKLYIVGVIEDMKVFEEISLNKHVINGTVTLVTADKYTKEASKMLYLADAAIATGRGVMEAASLGLPVLTIDSEQAIPILLTKDTFKDAFKTNFSGRNIFHNTSDNLADIEKLILDETYYQDISNYMKLMFEKHFDIKKASDRYNMFYHSCTNNLKFPLYHLNTLHALKSLYSFFKHSLKKNDK